MGVGYRAALEAGEEGIELLAVPHAVRAAREGEDGLGLVAARALHF